MSNNRHDILENLNQKDVLKSKMVRLLKRTGSMLKIYRSGKIPRSIKIISVLKNFEEILWFTRPDTWSPHALYAVTKLFLKNLRPLQLERFLTMVFIPRLQENIFQKNKKVSVHIFMTLKMISKIPKIFFSLIILPTAESLNFTTREAILFSILISKISVPREIVSTFLSMFLRQNFTNEKLILLNSILNKNFLLPIRMIDMLVDFFIYSKNFNKTIYFQKCFFSFLRNYSKFISKEDRLNLKKKIK